MDIALQPGQAGDPRVYMTLSTGTEQENRTILVRGIFDGRRVANIETIFRVEPAKSGAQHFGSRLLWLPDGTLLMSVGDGGNPPLRIGGMLAREQAQNRQSHLGAVLRLTADGKPAPDNPFVNDRTRGPRSGRTGTATSRASPATRSRAVSGPTSTGRSAATS
jgi:aldose sugar dehydrogenase